MKIDYPISRREAKYFLELEIGELGDETLNRILRFFEDNVISYEKDQAVIADYINREELEDKISDIAYSASQDMEWSIRDSIRGAIADAFR